MATKTIPDLQLISMITDDVNFAGDNGIQTYRATALQLKNYIFNKASITGQTEDTDPDRALDFLLSYDASADALKKVSMNRAGGFKIVSMTSGTGVNAGELALCNATSAGFTVSFPTAASGNSGMRIMVKKTDSSFNIVTLSGTGLTTRKLMTQNEWVEYISDGSNWVLLSSNVNTPFTSYTMTIYGSTSNPTKGSSIARDHARWRRVADCIEIHYVYAQTASTGAANGSGAYLLHIPNDSVWTMDTAKIAVPSSSIDTTYQIIGHGMVYNASIQMFCQWFPYSTTRFFANGLNEANRYIWTASDFPINSATYMVSAKVMIPITDFAAA